MIPQIIYTSILLFSCISIIAKCKEHKLITIFCVCFVLLLSFGLLYWGGFYNNILK